MADSGSVPLSIIEGVLSAHGVGISSEQVDGRQTTILQKRDVVFSVVLMDPVGRRMLHQLKRKLDIPIHHFYHPEQAPVRSSDTVH